MTRKKNPLWVVGHCWHS